jgi:BASS family bile acid:Na+ symporter
VFDTGVVPQPLMTAAAVVTVFTVMFALGLAIDTRDLRWAWERPWLVARGLISVLVVVPFLGVAVARTLGLSLEAQVGVALMAISPGAPVALRRSLDAGSRQSFAAVLQVLVGLLAIVSMPLSVKALNGLYGTHGSIDPASVMRQVFTAQLLPIGIGLTMRRTASTLSLRIEPAVRRTSGAMLMGLVLLVVAAIWPVAVGAAPRTVTAAVVVTVLAVAIGHVLGAPDSDTRTAVAVSSALKNPGLALLVATRNHVPPAVTANVLAYLLCAAILVTMYVAWRRRSQPRAAGDAPDTPPTVRPPS